MLDLGRGGQSSADGVECGGGRARASMRVLLPALCLLPLAACGYHVSGKADLIPKRVQTIAIPAFGNATTKYKLSENLTSSITREFIARTRYHIVANPDEAEAVLTGSVVNFFSYPTIFDPVTGRASGVQGVVVMQVTLT